jgi:hypothetical protein
VECVPGVNMDAVDTWNECPLARELPFSLEYLYIYFTRLASFELEAHGGNVPLIQVFVLSCL